MYSKVAVNSATGMNGVTVGNAVVNAAALVWRTPMFTRTGPISGAATGRAEVYLDETTGQSDPADLQSWKELKETNILKDPTSGGGNTLTRMHVINGTLYGPSESWNMVLGTHKSE